MSPETLERLRAREGDADLAALLAAYDRLTEDRAERLALFDIDPTGGMTPAERDDYRRKFREMAEQGCG